MSVQCVLPIFHQIKYRSGVGAAYAARAPVPLTTHHLDLGGDAIACAVQDLVESATGRGY
jgi:hypothetical protein